MTAQLLVLDSGLWQQKIGFSGDEAPRYTDQTLTGIPKNTAITSSHENRDVFIGESALQIQRYLHLKESLDESNQCCYSDLEKIWHELFYNKMKVNITEFPVFMALNPFFDMENKMSVVETLFESFNVPSLFMQSSSVTGLFAEGMVTGTVHDVGYSSMCSSFVFEGLLVESDMAHSGFGGKRLRQKIKGVVDKLISQPGEISETDLAALRNAKLDFPFYDNIKHRCFDNKDFQVELPDGTEVKLKARQFKETKTEFMNSNAEQLFNLIAKSKNEYLKELKQSICIQGGSTLVPGLDEHIKQYFYKRKIFDIDIVDHSNDEKMYNSWIGGSLYASLSTINSLLVSKQDYQEGGAAYVIRRNLL